MASPPASRPGLRALLRLPGFRQLLLIRFPSQTGDGAFQVGAAALLLFALDPNEATSAWEIAQIIAITALPFTVVGPLAGIFIDRWRRQRILVWSQLLRILTVIVTLPLATRFVAGFDWGQTVFYAGVLAVLSLNRFLLATLGAVTPRVVPGEALIPANAIASTGGSIAALVGASAGGVLASTIGDDAGGPEVTVLVSLALFAISAVVAARLPGWSLGPDLDGPPPPLREELRRAASDVAEGLRALASTRRAWAPITAFSLLRLTTTAASIAGLLVFRNVYGRGSDAVAQVLVAFGVGVFVGAVAIIVADRLGSWLKHQQAIRAAHALGGVAILTLVGGLEPSRIVAISGFLGVAFGISKVATDTIVQTALPDVLRGRLFTAYDVIVNLMVVGAGLLAAVALPQAERAEALYVVCGVAMLAIAVLSRRWLGFLPPPVDTATWTEAEHVLDEPEDPVTV